jgi:hypothetical protein
MVESGYIATWVWLYGGWIWLYCQLSLVIWWLNLVILLVEFGYMAVESGYIADWVWLYCLLSLVIWQLNLLIGCSKNSGLPKFAPLLHALRSDKFSLSFEDGYKIIQLLANSASISLCCIAKFIGPCHKYYQISKVRGSCYQRFLQCIWLCNISMLYFLYELTKSWRTKPMSL